ncbi:MAG: hypothetical protein ACOYN0_12050 [Phycisphaerales bacterium]
MADRLQQVLEQLAHPTPQAPPAPFLAGVRRIRRRRQITTAVACTGSLAALALAVLILRPLFTQPPQPKPREIARTAPAIQPITTAGALSLRGTTMDGATIPLSGELGAGGAQDVFRVQDVARMLESIEFAPRRNVTDPLPPKRPRR